MKHFGIAFIVFFLIFSSCSTHDWEDSVITNNSEFSVTFKFNNTKEFTLDNIGNTASFKTEAYQHLVYYTPEKRVNFTYKSTNDGYTGEFNNLPSWEIKVNNALGEKATLSANGWMDEMVDIISGYIDDDNHNGKIYTEKPTFSVKTESEFPAIAKYNFTENIFYVTIQWSP